MNQLTLESEPLKIGPYEQMMLESHKIRFHNLIHSDLELDLETRCKLQKFHRMMVTSKNVADIYNIDIKEWLFKALG